MNKKILFFVIFISSINSAYAANRNDSQDYDSIVNQLSSRSDGNIVADSLDNVRFHAGVGFVNSLMNLRSPDGGNMTVAHRGVQASFGIDLFSKSWIAEGSIRTFGESQFETYKISMRQFDLKLVYQNLISDPVYLRFAGGLSSRYLKMSSLLYNTDSNFTTPASLLSIGVGTNLSENFSIGGDLTAQNSMIEETNDRGSVDITIHLDGHF